ncbi:hypothetical protein P691DRAFT_829554 [Macrolepiota fuliginosa MF-IS2]|uniref:RRM domain-containing protein n=1 Tax=Macrolepiota fuliginosa MF-IS2 TaxID=1400762 RepID=A0A9P5XJ57_9AGAR|nr:hypothetical protein P691DRAFT_829554 [Macrolepiota fuliginosa MF-IS2]
MSAPPPSTAAGATAEAQAAAFANDPRVYFDKASDSWRYEEDDGTEMEFDASKGTWVPLLDEDLIKQQQAASTALKTPAAPVLKRENKKRKEPEDYTGLNGNGAAGPSKRGRGDKPPGERKSKNTAVYVTGLPLDAEPDEIVERFSRYGVLEEDDEGEPKVKMYAKEDGSFNGEALVVYFKEDSVTLAVSLLDEAELRLGDPSTVIRVSKADFAHKSRSTGNSGDQPRKVVNKKKATKRIGKMQKKLLEWDDEDGFGPAKTAEDDARDINKNSRVVVLKYMFTLEDLEKDASLLLDLKEDVREECSTLGEVTNVVLYDKEKDGIMTVKFRDPISAQACILKMNGRFFDGRRIEAALYLGRQRFRRSGAGDDLEESEDSDKKRLDDFAQWLMTEGD